MQIFPRSTYEYELIDGPEETLERLKRRTKQVDTLVSSYTDKSFIGKIEKNKFELISSSIGRGALTVMSGTIAL